MDAFDADVVVYAAMEGHELGGHVRALFAAARADVAGIGSVLLLPEVLSKPLHADAHGETEAIMKLLSRLDLRPADEATATLATSLRASYGLRTVDAIHLATAVGAGADRFITNNRRDFPKSIAEIDITYPDDLELA